MTKMAKRKKNRKFIQKATQRMEEKGTVGAFGKATPSKIKRAKAHGGVEKKRAIFAQNMKRIAQRRKHGRKSSKRSRRRSGRR